MTVTNYLWDEENITLEYDDADATLAEYTYEPEVYGNLVSERRDDETYQHNYDALGSTRTLTDTSGQVTDTFEFDAWGNELVRTGTTETPFRWVGEIGYLFDDEVAAYAVRRRSYDPQIGRWRSCDPIGFRSTVNRYSYANNNAVCATDPTGLVPIRCRCVCSTLDGPGGWEEWRTIPCNAGSGERCCSTSGICERNNNNPFSLSYCTFNGNWQIVPIVPTPPVPVQLPTPSGACTGFCIELKNGRPGKCNIKVKFVRGCGFLIRSILTGETICSNFASKLPPPEDRPFTLDSCRGKDCKCTPILRYATPASVAISFDGTRQFNAIDFIHNEGLQTAENIARGCVITLQGAVEIRSAEGSIGKCQKEDQQVGQQVQPQPVC